MVFGSLFLVLALLLFALGRVSAGAAVVAGNHRVTVAAGDTLWSIAQRAAPQTDPRVEVGALESVNHLAAGAALEPGQILLLPASD